MRVFCSHVEKKPVVLLCEFGSFPLIFFIQNIEILEEASKRRRKTNDLQTLEYK
jgi:hypothetical protein